MFVALTGVSDEFPCKSAVSFPHCPGYAAQIGKLRLSGLRLAIPYKVPSNSVGLVTEYFEEVELFRGVVLRDVVRLERSLKFVFEDGMFGDVFGDDVRVSSVGSFGTNAP